MTPMPPLRLVIVGERFWPVVEPCALAIEQLGRALADLGTRVTYLTGKAEKGWPDWFPLRGSWGTTQVHYLPTATRMPFAPARFGRSIQHWLEAHADEFDSLIVAGAGEFLSVPLRWIRERGVPGLVWIWSGSARQSTAAWEELAALDWEGSWARRIQIVCECREFAARWRNAGMPEQVLRRVEPAIALPSPIHRLSRASLRGSLAQADPRLQIAANQPVCLVLGPIYDRGQWLELLQAWSLLIRRERRARLWLMGDGEGFAQLWEQARRLEVLDSVEFVGWFDDLDEIFQVVDLCIVPDRDPWQDRQTLRAVATGLPVLALAGADSIAGSVERIGGGVACGSAVRTLAGSSRGELAAGIAAALAADRSAPDLAAAQAWVARHRDVAATASLAEQWIRQLREPPSRVGT